MTEWAGQKNILLRNLRLIRRPLTRYCQPTPVSAIREIKHQSDTHPYEKTYPRHQWQTEHKIYTEYHPQYRDHWAERGFEWPRYIRLRIAQIDYTATYQGKCRQGANIHQFSHHPNREKSGNQCHQQSADQNNTHRCLGTRMNCRK